MPQGDVPHDVVDDVTPPPMATTHPEQHDQPFAEFVIHDDDTWVYDTEEPSAAIGSADARPVDPNKVAVSRRIIYLQGILLGLVALGGFVFGLMVGAGSSSQKTAQQDVPTPCTISGQVAFRDGRNELVPDAGSVVIALPSDARPDERTDIGGLRPEDPTPADNHPGIFAIRQIGGDYARADHEGNFRLRLPDSGKYFVLFVSRRQRRVEGAELSRRDLAQIGRYFMPAMDLLGGSQYHWSEESVRRDRTLSHVF